MGVGRAWRHDIYIEMLYQEFVGFDETRLRLAIAIHKGICIDIQGRTLPTLLLVAYPAYHWHHAMEERTIVHAMFAMEVGSMSVVLAEEVEGVNNRVVVAKESIDMVVVVGSMLEVEFAYLAVFLFQGFGYEKFCFAISTRILPLLFASHAMLLHGVVHAEGRVDTNAVDAIELFGIHTTHGSTNDKVGLFALTDIVEQAYSLSGMEWHVVGYNLGIRECFADASNCSRLGRRAEAMDIHYLFARHEVGVLLDIGIFHNK